MAIINRAIHQSYATDDAGNIVPFADIVVRDEVTGTIITVYPDRSGTVPVVPPLQADAKGYFHFYVQGGRYRIDVTKNGVTSTKRNVAIGTAQEYDANDLLFAFPMFWQAANKPGLGEDLPPLDLPLPVVLYDDFVGWNARLRIAPTSNQTISIRYRPSLVVADTQIATLTFLAGAFSGTFSMADDTPLVAGGQIWPRFPNPRDATMADFSMCILARR